MATAFDSSESSVCSICYGSYENPLKLPGCLHSFCENCLLTYISNLKADDRDFDQIQCPNCRKQICLPKGTNDLHIWLKSLEVEGMASTKTTDITKTEQICISCKDTESLVPAEKYCVDCDESLCASCSRIRHRSKLLHGHNIVDLQTMQEHMKDGKNLIYTVAEYIRCEKHPDKTVSVICKDDSCLCCTDCIIKNHRHCESIITLESGDFESVNKLSITKTKEYAEKIISQLKALADFNKGNIVDVKQKSERLTDSVKDLRTTINTLFDALEVSISVKAKAVAKKHVIEAEEVVSKIKETSNTLKDYITLMEDISSVQLDSDVHIYILLSKLESKIREAERTVSKLSQTCGRYEITLKIESILQNLSVIDVNDVDHLTEVTEDFQKTAVSGLEGKFEHKFNGVEKSTEKSILPVSPPDNRPEYYGVTYLKNAKTTHYMFLASVYESFCFPVDNRYRAVGCFNKNILAGQPYSVTELKSGEVAVSLRDQNRILFFSENEDKTQFEITSRVNTKFTPRALYGMSNGEIAVSWNKPVGFSFLKFSWTLYAIKYKEKKYFVNDTAGRILKTFDFMTVDEKRSHVIQPCTEDKAVYCFDFDGNPKFKYSHDDLVYPRGVGISKNGNIFACDEQKYVIHVISPYGVGLHVIRNNVPVKPLGIAFDRSGMEFAVTQNAEPWTKVVFYRLL